MSKECIINNEQGNINSLNMLTCHHLSFELSFANHPTGDLLFSLNKVPLKKTHNAGVLRATFMNQLSVERT